MSASSCWCKDAIGVAGPSSNVLLNPWLKHTIEEFPELLEPIEKQFFCFFLWWDTLALKDTQNLKHTQLLDNVGILANQCLGSLVNLSMIYCIFHPFGTIFSKKQQCSRQIFQKVKKKSKRITTQHVTFYPEKKISKIKPLHLRQSSGHFYQAFSKWLQQPLALGASPAAVLPWVEGPWVPSAPPPRFQPRGEVRWHCWRQRGKCPRRG